ncbi:MAG: O-antigen ligase family protein [bacterium]|nr:O-antigen ligase family protein [bacterium]
MNLNKALLVINVFFLQAYLIRFNIGPYPSNLQEILIGLNTLAFIFITPFSQIMKSLRKHWVILILIWLAGLSMIFVPMVSELDLIRHSKFLLFASALSYIFLETFKEEKERMAGLRIMGVGAIVFGIFSVSYNLLGYNVTHDLRLLGPLDAAVYLAFYLTPFFIYLSIQAFETRDKSFVTYAVILAGLIIATRSMGAIGGSLVVMIFYFFKRSNLKFLKSKFNKALILIISLSIIGTIFYSKIQPTLDTEYSSLDERSQIWLVSREFLKTPKTAITGIGFGQFQQHYFDNVKDILNSEPLDYYVLQPHNIFLLFIFHFGILGLVFIVILMHKTIIRLLEFKKIDSQIIAGFLLLYFFIHGMIDTPIFKNDLLILFLIFTELSLIKTRNKLS